MIKMIIATDCDIRHLIKYNDYNDNTMITIVANMHVCYEA